MTPTPSPAPRRTVVVTGGTAGLGLALVRRLVAAGDDVYACARTPRGVLAGLPGVRFLHADLAGPSGCDALLAALGREGVERIDLLVHNAADGWYGALDAMPPERVADLVALNVSAPILLTRSLAPALAAARGKVVLIGSVAAALPAARYAVYAATKAALDGFARSLAEEWRDRIAVQVIHPGAIATDFHARVGAGALDRSRFASPDAVADAVLEAMRGGRWRAFTGRMPAALARIGSLAAPVVDAIARGRERRTAAVAAASPVAAEAAGRPRRALVTGAASGLGAALVEALRAGGYRDIVGVDLSGDGPGLMAADLADPAARVRISTTAAADGPFDLVIHCAGISAVGPFERAPPAALRRVLDVNLVAPIELTLRLLAGAAIARDATIVFVGSLSSYTGYPGAAVYAASKDGLAAFSRSAGIALAGGSRHVLAVFPGPMKTPHARRYAPRGASEVRRIEPARVARAIEQVLGGHRTRLVVGAGPRAAALLGTLFPGLMTRLMGRTLWPKLRDRQDGDPQS